MTAKDYTTPNKLALYEVTIKRTVLIAATTEDAALDVAEGLLDCDPNDFDPADVSNTTCMRPWMVNARARSLVPCMAGENTRTVAQLIESGDLVIEETAP